MGLLSVDEQLLHVGTARISAPPQPPSSASREAIEDYERRFGAWERLRELVAKAAVEAHAKEIVYGGPLLVGQLPKKTGRLEAVLAPLFMQAVRAEVLSNGDVELSAVNKSPRFNTVVWREAVDTKAVEQIVALGVEAQGELAAGWDPARVQTLLEGIASVMPGLVPAEPGNAVNRWPMRPDARSLPQIPRLDVHDGAVVFLANRSSPYLLNDLETIAASPERVVREDRPLSVLLREPSGEDRPEAVAPNLDEVVLR